MGETRHRIFPAESLVQHIVKRERRQPLLSADDLADFHEMVVHDVCKMISREFVSPLPEHFVIKGIGIDLDMAADKVIHLHYRVLRHLEAYGPCISGLEEILYLVLRQGEGIA